MGSDSGGVGEAPGALGSISTLSGPPEVRSDTIS